MEIYRILKKAEGRKVVLDYAGDVSEFNDADEALQEFEECGIDDEDAKYHLTRTTLYINVK